MINMEFSMCSEFVEKMRKLVVQHYAKYESKGSLAVYAYSGGAVDRLRVVLERLKPASDDDREFLQKEVNLLHELIQHPHGTESEGIARVWDSWRVSGLMRDLGFGEVAGLIEVPLPEGWCWLVCTTHSSGLEFFDSIEVVPIKWAS